jgi:hypothetical protein
VPAFDFDNHAIFDYQVSSKSLIEVALTDSNWNYDLSSDFQAFHRQRIGQQNLVD